MLLEVVSYIRPLFSGRLRKGGEISHSPLTIKLFFCCQCELRRSQTLHGQSVGLGVVGSGIRPTKGLLVDCYMGASYRIVNAALAPHVIL
jgi:hypothetical protein